MQQEMCISAADETIKDAWQANKHIQGKHLLVWGITTAVLLFIVESLLQETYYVAGKQFNRSNKPLSQCLFMC